MWGHLNGLTQLLRPTGSGDTRVGKPFLGDVSELVGVQVHQGEVLGLEFYPLDHKV